MKRTVSIPVDLPSTRFLPLMNQCAEIFNAYIDWALANSTYNKNKAHKELYHLLRVQFPSVPSALLQTVRDNALEAVKATKFKSIPRKKPTSGLRYDKRTMTLHGHQLTLSCIGKRVKLILEIPDYFKHSQKCNVCKHIKRTNRHKSKFQCKNCGHQTHADLNASRNVRDDYILSSTYGTEEQGSVNAPCVSGNSIS